VNEKINNSSENREIEMFEGDIDTDIKCEDKIEKLENYVKEGNYNSAWDHELIEIENGEYIPIGTLIKKYTKLNDELWRNNQYMEDLELSIIDYLITEESSDESNPNKIKDVKNSFLTCDFLPEEVLRKVKFPDGMQFYKLNVDEFYIFKNPEASYDHIDGIIEISEGEYISASSFINSYIYHQNILLDHEKYINQLLNDLIGFSSENVDKNYAPLDRYVEIKEGKYITVASLRDKFIQVRNEVLILEDLLLEMKEDLIKYDPDDDGSKYGMCLKSKDLELYCRNSPVHQHLVNILDEDYPHERKRIFNQDLRDRTKNKGLTGNFSSFSVPMYEKYFYFIGIEKDWINGKIVDLGNIVEISPGKFITVESLKNKYLFLLNKLGLNFLIEEKVGYSLAIYYNYGPLSAEDFEEVVDAPTQQEKQIKKEEESSISFEEFAEKLTPANINAVLDELKEFRKV